MTKIKKLKKTRRDEAIRCQYCGVKVKKYDKCKICQILLHDKDEKMNCGACKGCKVQHTLRSPNNNNLCFACDQKRN